MNEDMTIPGTILVVDDTPTNLEVLFDFLSNAGFKVLFAEDGESALETVNYATPDLILLDILMPGLDGFETCRRLKANQSTTAIPVIFLTALTDTSDKVKGFELGAVDFITKPLQYEEVLARVKTHLRLQSLTRQLQNQNIQLEQQVEERRQTALVLQQQHQRSQLFADVTLKIRQSLHIDTILQTAVTEVKQILQADRVLIYRLLTDSGGSAVAEAVQPGWPQVMGATYPQEMLSAPSRQHYESGQIASVADVTLDGDGAVAPGLADFFHQFQVRAKLVVPILTPAGLWGLLIAHHCSAPRHWTTFETDLLQQLADQIAIALTQAQLLEQETRQRQELARSNSELQQFAYIASHDLQEPLRMVTSYLQLLERRYQGQLDADADDFIQFAVDGARRMRTLISDLLAFSRISTQGQSFELTSTADAVLRATANLKLAIDENAAVITWSDLPQVYADPTQLTQLFQNLIGNAIKFRSAVPCQITLEAIQKEDVWQFAIQDNGIGLDPEYAERIFVIFQRLNNRMDYPGTGIGLALCKKIVERHGGDIWVESAPDHGATFYFTIPQGGANNP